MFKMAKKVIGYLVIILSFFFTFNLVRGVWDSYKNESKLQGAQKQLSQAKNQNEELKKELEFKQSEYFIEKEAREKLNLVKKGEVVAVLPQLENKKEVDQKQRVLENWKKWFEFFFD